MKHLVEKNKIVINSKEDFCPQHILECGQIFSYVKTDSGYNVYSKDKMARVTETETGIEIETSHTDYFVNFFDLNSNYFNVKQQLIKKHKFMQNVINFGSGIRILNQDIFETIISFIVSANNNIKRIQKILFAIREKYGSNMGDYFAFPSIKQLKRASIDDFRKLGAGYRAEYLYKAVRQLENEDFLTWTNLSTNELNKKLLSIMGVGQKVADCIMLFAFSRRDVFPVDTWIEKVYCTYFETETNRAKIRQNLLNVFGDLSGYAQQYLFYSQRSENKQLKNEPWKEA